MVFLSCLLVATNRFVSSWQCMPFSQDRKIQALSHVRRTDQGGSKHDTHCSSWKRFELFREGNTLGDHRGQYHFLVSLLQLLFQLLFVLKLEKDLASPGSLEVFLASLLQLFLQFLFFKKFIQNLPVSGGLSFLVRRGEPFFWPRCRVIFRLHFSNCCYAKVVIMGDGKVFFTFVCP